MPDVAVLYFAQARDRLGATSEVLTLSSPAGAGDVLAAIRARHPAHTALIDRCRVAIDHQFTDAPVTITERSEIALIPPVSGG
jgi:molybdopterin converting factor subunit 1